MTSALMACALWGLAFLGPALVDGSAFELTIVRYLFFGLSSIAILALCRHNPFRTLDARGWLRIIGLGLFGNSMFYTFISLGVQSANPVSVALVVATLPLLITLVGNVRRKAISWRRLAGPTVLVAAGVTLNALPTGVEDVGGSIALGLILAGLGVLSWLIYAIWNAEYLADNPMTKTIEWTSLTGLGTFITLPAVYAVAALIEGEAPVVHGLNWSVIGWGALLGLGSSWLATWAWSRASMSLPAALLGVLVVGESMSVILYTSIYEWALPEPRQWVVIVLVVAGVIWALRAAQSSRAGQASRAASAADRSPEATQV